MFGYAGQVDGLVARLREELGEEATAIATGGFAGTIVPHCEQIDETDELLTLRGLRIIWERNREPYTMAPLRAATDVRMDVIARCGR